MPGLVVVGAQWGDEGKGKITDLLAGRAQLVVRFAGGANAGHTLMVDGQVHKLHLIPSGILHPDVRNLIGHGCVVDLEALAKELDALEPLGVGPARLGLSPLAHLVMPWHKLLDSLQEQRRGKAAIGTTGRGIGPAYADKAARHGLRAGDMRDADVLRERVLQAAEDANHRLTRLHDAAPVDGVTIADRMEVLAERFRPYLADVTEETHAALAEGRNVLFEGAQGALLDLDLGTWPFVTSSHAVAAGACLGAGVGPKAIGRVMGITKAYATRVGSGPFPSELLDETGERLRQAGAEFGTTTGRPRRCGWLDLVALRHAVRINGLDSLALTKLDILDDFAEIGVVEAYEGPDGQPGGFPADPADLGTRRPVVTWLPGWQARTSDARTIADLPEAARAYLDHVATAAGVPVTLVGVGGGREQTLMDSDPFTGREVLA
ncbi:MAG: adenylosuccinate synthase [Candidatus Sericytochromatia bacterium]|nr:adenylosuccinate synthase [Candidatus Tanganyikabacteria bacterium]